MTNSAIIHERRYCAAASSPVTPISPTGRRADRRRPRPDRRQADPQDIAAHIGDAVAGLQLVIPALRIRAAKGKEARVRAAIDRIQQFGIAEYGPGNAFEKLLLQVRAMRRNARCGEADLCEHAPDCREPVQRRRVKGRAEEAARVPGMRRRHPAGASGPRTRRNNR